MSAASLLVCPNEDTPYCTTEHSQPATTQLTLVSLCIKRPLAGAYNNSGAGAVIAKVSINALFSFHVISLSHNKACFLGEQKSSGIFSYFMLQQQTTGPHAITPVLARAQV